MAVAAKSNSPPPKFPTSSFAKWIGSRKVLHSPMTALWWYLKFDERAAIRIHSTSSLCCPRRVHCKFFLAQIKSALGRRSILRRCLAHSSRRKIFHSRLCLQQRRDRVRFSRTEERPRLSSQHALFRRQIQRKSHHPQATGETWQRL